MEQQAQLAASRMIESLNGWWALAGVDAAVGEDAVDWFALDAKPDVVVVPTTPKVETKAIAPNEAKVEWPQDIGSLQTLISTGAALPGNVFSNRPVTPVGPTNAQVMVVSDLPDADELTAGKLGTGANGVLLERMLSAIGVKLTDCYWTALATTIPATGALPDGDLPELATFVRHQIGLVGPAGIILLGSAASRAILSLELMEARQSLRDIKDDGGKKAVLTTFHPRTLIARPQMKAQAWKDLQMFAKRDVL